MRHPITEAERGKYVRMWSVDKYADNSPGEQIVPLFERMMKPAPGATILDIGAGAGAGSIALKARGYHVEAFDLTDTRFDRASGISLHLGSIWHGLPYPFSIGFCCDVMEHLPTQFVGLAVREMLKACRALFLKIYFDEEAFGEFIGEPLHLTVQPFTWWRDTLREVGQLVDARDLMGHGVFHVR